MKQNLNFNYRLIFLPQHLMDYVIAHELCHLKHFNHGEAFWKLLEETIPNYREHKRELVHHARAQFFQEYKALHPGVEFVYSHAHERRGDITD